MPYSLILFVFSSRRPHTSWPRDWSSDVCSSDLNSERKRLATLHQDVKDLLLRGRSAKAQGVWRTARDYFTAARTKAADEPGLEGLCREADRCNQIGRASCRERGGVSVVAEAGKA